MAEKRPTPVKPLTIYFYHTRLTRESYEEWKAVSYTHLLSNGVQQLLNLFFGIFLSRILNAEDYGMVGMLSILSLIAGSLQESGFTAALANKREISHKDYKMGIRDRP